MQQARDFSVVKISNLRLDYEVRVIGEKKWYRSLFSADYRMKPVLTGVDLVIAKPKIIAILGRNGSGKTTLIKTMCGLLKPTAGSMDVLGFQPHRHESDFLSKIGAVFGQKRMLWPELSIKENFELLGAIYKIPVDTLKERSNELIALFNLEKFNNRPAKSLSLGEGMRAEVAASLLHQPSVLFLDEPTVGMDLESQIMMRRAIKKYTEATPFTVFLTSHNTQDIADLADEIYIIEGGKLESLAVDHTDSLSKIASIEKRLLTS